MNLNNNSLLNYVVHKIKGKYTNKETHVSCDRIPIRDLCNRIEL